MVSILWSGRVLSLFLTQNCVKIYRTNFIPRAESQNSTSTVHGLTEFGKVKFSVFCFKFTNLTIYSTYFVKDVVLEMNRLGMMVDLAHVSKQVMLDVLKISEAPVIFSHSSAANLTNIPRNVDDEVLLLLVREGKVANNLIENE